MFAGKFHITHWLPMNCNLGDNEQWKKSKIFTCITQDNDQWSDHRYYMQLANGRYDSIYNKFLKTSDYWVLTSSNKEHTPNCRKP
jgi:hypothetical protein